MRIAVYHNLPSGGAKRTLYETVSRLLIRHEVHVYTLSTADERFCDLRPIVQSFKAYPFIPSHLFHSPLGRLNQLQRWRDLWRLDRVARHIAAEIDAGHFDVVFAQPCVWTQAPLVLRHLRTPSAYYCQEPPRALYETIARTRATGAARAVLDRVDPLIPLYRSAARRLDWEAAQAAGVMLVNSEFIRDAAARIYGLSPVVSYHGVDTQVFHPQPEISRAGSVLSVGAIQPHKGFDFLIESLATLPDAARPQLRLVGNAELSEEHRYLQELAARLGVDLQIEMGVTEEVLVRRYNEASLLAYAPHKEPFGLVPLEAMACGTPVIAVAEGGVRESVLDGVSGLLVGRDRRLFADAVWRLLRDSRLRQTFGRQAREHVLKRWTWDSAVERIEAQLEHAARGEGRPVQSERLALA